MKENRLMKQPFTKITFETYYPIENDYRKSTVAVNKWDCTVDDVLDILEQLLTGAGFNLGGKLCVDRNDQ